MWVKKMKAKAQITTTYKKIVYNLKATKNMQNRRPASSHTLKIALYIDRLYIVMLWTGSFSAECL